jgi:hypothetical protein
MTSLSIPEMDLPVFKTIVELNDAQITSLAAALNETGATLKQSAFADQISNKIKTIGPSDVAAIG